MIILFQKCLCDVSLAWNRTKSRTSLKSMIASLSLWQHERQIL